MTGAEVNERCSEPFPLFAILPDMKYPERWPMAATKANYVGEPVAAVVASSRATARDAIDLIEVEYEPLPVVTDMETAPNADQPVIHEELGTNLCYEATGPGGRPRSRLCRGRRHGRGTNGAAAPHSESHGDAGNSGGL